MKFLSVSQLAKQKRQTPQAIRKAIKEKRIKAIKVGSFYIIEIPASPKAS